MAEEKETGKQVAPILDPNTLASSFITELTNVGGSVIRTAPQDVTHNMIEFLKTRGVTRIALEPDSLDEAALEEAGITTSHAPDAALLFGVTKAVCGLADTGSLMIVDGDGDPLKHSLLPRVHIAVLCRSTILPSLGDALTLPIVRGARSTAVITGPSRTADIEMSLTIGMHGPGEVHVFLVDD